MSVIGVMAADPLTLTHDEFQVMTAAEAAELIRLPRSSVYELARNGRIPFIRIGRRIFFIRGVLIQWLIDEMTDPRNRNQSR